MINKICMAGLMGIVVLFAACSNPTETNKGAGTILNIYMPDSLKLPSTMLDALVRAQVEDPDGLKDIKTVSFLSRKPDGEYAAGGNPIYMFDDGSFGDEIANDGIYTTGIQIDNQAQVGTYIFTFEMLDKAGNVSPSVTDSIKVYE